MVPHRQGARHGLHLQVGEARVTLASRWTIEDFKTKMETFKQGQQLESSQFVIGGLKLCINLYPNGRSAGDLFQALQF